MENKSMWVDYGKIFSFNAFINMIITERGIGKTYGASKAVVDDYKKNNYEFAYIRRYKSELKKAVPNFFQAINKNNEFPNDTLTSKGNSFYCNGNEFRLCNDTFYCTRS